MSTELVIGTPFAQKANTLSNLVAEYLYLKYKTLAPSTKRYAKFVLEEFEIFAQGKEIDRKLFIQWNEAQEKRGLKASSINHKAIVLSQFFRWCEHQELIVKSPHAFIQRHKQHAAPLPAIYTEAEYEAIKAFTKGSYLYFMTVLGYRTGMSMVDICYLRWPSIDMENLVIRTSRIKMSRHGPSSVFTVPLLAQSDIHLLLQSMKDAHTNRFSNKNDEYVNPDLSGLYSLDSARVSENYTRMLAKIGIKGKTFKNFRNTFISNVANSGMNIGLACKLTAHTDPKIYTQYIRPDVDALRTGLQAAFQWASEKTTVKQLRKPESQ